MGRPRKPPGFKILRLAEACELTDLEPEELVRKSGVERLERRFADGRREEAVRIPAELIQPTGTELTEA